jgi:fluoride ion exporter CrcB/FEX
MAQQQLSSGQQQFIFDQFNGTTYQPNAMDVQHEPLYDTYTAAAAATIPNNTQFFTTPSGKTINQTNVTTPKKLDAPEAFAVMGIRFKPLENILLADFVNLMSSFVLEFWIGQKYYNRGPLWHYNAGGGISGFTTQSSTSAYTNGLTGRIHMNELAINIVVDNQASFYGNLNGVPVVLTASGSGGTGATLQMLLDGLHARGVQ